MVCKRCGHALGSNEAICPNCGAMMSKEQLEIRKELNKDKNIYQERIYNIKQKNKYNNEDTTNTNNTAYAIFIVICILVLAIIIAAILLR